MSDYEFSGELGLDPSAYVSGADEAADASADVGAATDGMNESLIDVDARGAAAGGALAGLGTAAQSVLDSTRETREGLDRTAETMGITSDAATDLATDMSDATFDLDDVEGTMDSLAEMGVDSADDMEELGLQMDEIADATGNTAESVTDNVGPALRAMGEDVDDVGEHADTFTHIAENTTMELDEFSRMTTKLGPELQEMGMGVDDTAAVMGALEEKGLDSRTAMTEFRQASNNADGDQEELMESLGLTSEELDEQHDALADAEGMTQDHAEAANDNVSTMDDLRAGLEDAKLAAADYLGPIDAIAPAAQAAGIAAMTMSTINMTALVPSFAAVSTAAAPITAVVLGLAAAVTAAYAIWERDIGGIQGKTEAAVDGIMDGLEWLVDGLGEAIDTADYILTEWSPGDTLSSKRDAIAEPVDDVRELIPGDLDEATDLAMDVFTSWHPAGIIWDKRDQIMDALPIPDEWRERGEDLVSGFIDGIRDMAPDVGGAVSDLADTADEYLPSSDAERGAFSGLTDAGAAIPETLGGAAAGNADSLGAGMGEMAGTASGGGGGSGGVSADAIRQALEGMSLALDGTLSVDGDVATMDDVNAEIRRAGRQAGNRGIQ